VTGITRSKLPADAPPLLVALHFDRQHLPASCRLVFQAPGERIALQYSDLNLGYVQPTAMDGACNETRRAARCAEPWAGEKASYRAADVLRVQVILDNANVFRMRIGFIDQPLDAVHVVDLRAMVRHFDMPYSSKIITYYTNQRASLQYRPILALFLQLLSTNIYW
jgi:hypothetical protein